MPLEIQARDLSLVHGFTHISDTTPKSTVLLGKECSSDVVCESVRSSNIKSDLIDLGKSKSKPTSLLCATTISAQVSIFCILF